MEITDIKIRKATAEGKLKAYVNVTFDDCFVVHDIKVIGGSKGTFVAMPSRKLGEDDFRDIAHPTQQFMRDLIKDTVLREYDEALRERMQMSEEDAENVAARFF